MLKKLINVFIFIIIVILIFDVAKNEKDILLNKIEMTNYIEGKKYYDKEDSVVIKIPKINIKSIVKKEVNNFSNLNNNLVYYDNGKTIFIFGHSGLGFGTYFNRLDELSVNDLVYLYKNGKQVYKVNKIYYINEEDIGVLNRKNEDELYLITCKKSDNKKRLVVKLVKK